MRISETGSAAVLFMLALAALYSFTDKYAALLLLAYGAIAGQFLFVQWEKGYYTAKNADQGALEKNHIHENLVLRL